MTQRATPAGPYHLERDNTREKRCERWAFATFYNDTGADAAKNKKHLTARPSWAAPVERLETRLESAWFQLLKLNC